MPVWRAAYGSAALPKDQPRSLRISRVAYLASRTYPGWSGRDGGSPEPSAYESDFGTRCIIPSQITGDAALDFDPPGGPPRCLCRNENHFPAQRLGPLHDVGLLRPSKIQVSRGKITLHGNSRIVGHHVF
jgi:hypothetical protein